MATETDQLLEVSEKDFQTGEETTRPMTAEEYADYLATLEYIAKNPVT